MSHCLMLIVDLWDSIHYCLITTVKETGTLIIEKTNTNYFSDVYSEVIFHCHIEESLMVSYLIIKLN
jgi:hypothetical protein